MTGAKSHRRGARRHVPRRRRKPLPDARTSGRATGVPGAGRCSTWRIALTAGCRGTACSTSRQPPKRLHRHAAARRHVNGDYAESHAPDVVAYFSQAGGPGSRPAIVAQSAYAAFLRRLAAEGISAFYPDPPREDRRANPRGTARRHDDAGIRQLPPGPAPALCRTWRVVQVCGPPPPASGVGLLQLLSLLERTDIAARDQNDPQAWFLFAEASRIMYADRDHYVGDPAVVRCRSTRCSTPITSLQRARLIGERAGPAPPAGAPAVPVVAGATRRSRPEPRISSLSMRHGNAVSMTTTVESFSARADGRRLLPQQPDDGLFRSSRPAGACRRQFHCAG